MSPDASTMTIDDQRLADILSLLRTIDERLPKRRVKATEIADTVPESNAGVSETEKPKRVRKQTAKAAETADAAPAEAKTPRKPRAKKAPDLEGDVPDPAPAKAPRKPRAKKAATTDSE